MTPFSVGRCGYPLPAPSGFALSRRHWPIVHSPELRDEIYRLEQCHADEMILTCLTVLRNPGLFPLEYGTFVQAEAISWASR